MRRRSRPDPFAAWVGVLLVDDALRGGPALAAFSEGRVAEAVEMLVARSVELAEAAALEREVFDK